MPRQVIFQNNEPTMTMTEASTDTALEYVEYMRLGADISPCEYRSASVAMVPDMDGLYRVARDNEPRFPGMRRVENLVTDSDKPEQQTIDVIDGHEYAVSMGVCPSTAMIMINDMELFGDGKHRRAYAVPMVADCAVMTVYVCGPVSDLMIEDVTGQANQAPSEYVSSSVDYGLGLSGVRVFAYDKTSQVVDNNIIESYGAHVVTHGALVEPGYSNILRNSSDFRASMETFWELFDYAAIAREIVRPMILHPDAAGVLCRATGSASAAGFYQTISCAGSVDILYLKAENVDALETEIRIWDGSDAEVWGNYVWNTATLHSGHGPDAQLNSAAAEILPKKGPNGGDVVVITLEYQNLYGSAQVEVYPSGRTSNTLAAIVHHVQLVQEPTGTVKTTPIVRVNDTDTPRAKETLLYPFPNDLVNNFAFAVDYTPEIDLANIGKTIIDGTMTTGFGIAERTGGFRLRTAFGNLNFQRFSEAANATASIAFSPVAGTTYTIRCRVSSTVGVDVWLDAAKGTNHANTDNMDPINDINIGNSRKGLGHAAQYKNFRLVRGNLTDEQILSM